VSERTRRRIPTASSDHVFAEALAEASGHGDSRQRQEARKAQQLCRQVQRAINLALADGGPEVDDLFVEAVMAGPGGPLIVHVVVPAGRRVTEALDALRRDASRLRIDVARAITRKRAPELTFVAVPGDGGEDA
jgi:ribosome-binding factor A